MYCPKCAAPVSDGQKFCRSCGLNLQSRAQIVTGPSPGVEPNGTLVEHAERRQRRQRRVLFWGVTTSAGGATVAMLFGYLYDVMKAKAGVMDPTTVSLLSGLTAFGMVTLLAGAGLMGFWGFLRIAALRLLTKPSAPPQAVMNAMGPPGRPPEPMPSVTEHTTARLKISEVQALTPDPLNRQE